MKKVVVTILAFALIAVMAAGSARAESGVRMGALGMNLTVLDPVLEDGFIISGKYFVTRDVALLAGLGLGIKGEDASGTDFGVILGGRKYLSTTDFAPFAGGRLTYSTTQDGDVKNTSLMGEFGAEYFLHKQFSIEGSVGFGYTSESRKLLSTTTTVTNVGTSRLGVSFNYYFF